MTKSIDRLAAMSAAVVVLLVAACGAKPWSDVTFDLDADPRVRAAEVTHEDGSGTDLLWLDFGGGHGGWFILDTGAAVAIVDDDFAGALGLEVAGIVRANGVPATLRKAPPLSVGGMRVSDPMFVALDLDPLLDTPGTGFGDRYPVVGVVGYALLKSAVVRIEYRPDGDRVFLFNPAAYRLPEGETWTPLRLEDRAPAMRASVSGVEGLFKLDTGKTFAASLTAAFVAANGLAEGVELELSDNRRLEGTVQEAVAEVAYVELAGQRIEHPTVGFRQHEQESATALDGVIGREILERFTMTLDYPGSRISLHPR